VTDEELQHLRQLRRITTERRRELERQAAAYGSHTPAHIAVEIRGTEEELARIDAKMRTGSISPAVQEATGPEASIDVLRMEVKHLREMISQAMRTVTTDILDMRDESRAWRETQEDKHERGALRYQAGFLVFGLAIVVMMMLIAWIIGRLPL
jgi:hypothetical protein